MKKGWRCLRRPWLCFIGVFGLIDSRPASRRQIFASLVIVLVVMGAGFSVGLYKLSGEVDENDRQGIEIARASNAAADNRRAADLALCKRVADVHGKILINAVGLRRVLDPVLAIPPRPDETSQSRQIRRKFQAIQNSLRKAQVELKRERDRNCSMSVRPRNGEERILDDIIGDKPKPPPLITPGRTTTITTTVPGPSSTRTVTGPGMTSTRTVTQRETITPPTRTITRATTITLPPRTETAHVAVPGPTQTVTQTVPVVVPPVTVTVTVPEAPTLTGTTTGAGTP